MGAGGCGRGDPSPTRQRALFRAGFARYGGGTRAPRGRAPPAWVWGVRCRALSHPRLPALWAGCRGPLPTGCGCGGVRAWGPVTNPTTRALASWLCALWGRHEGARAGAPPAWVWGVRGRALSHPRLPALWAGCRGPLPTGCGSGGVRAGGPVTSPTARALASWLCALWGRHEGASGGAPLAWVWGVRGRALSHPRLPALWAGCRGPLPTGCGCGAVRARQKHFTAARVTHPSRATRGHQPRAARRGSSQLAARSAAQQLAAPPRDSAASVKEVRGPELRHQQGPSADQQGRTPSYSNHFHNHRPTSTGRTPGPVLHHPPQQTPPGPVR